MLIDLGRGLLAYVTVGIREYSALSESAVGASIGATKWTVIMVWPSCVTVPLLCVAHLVRKLSYGFSLVYQSVWCNRRRGVRSIALATQVCGYRRFADAPVPIDAIASAYVLAPGPRRRSRLS